MTTQYAVLQLLVITNGPTTEVWDMVPNAHKSYQKRMKRK